MNRRVFLKAAGTTCIALGLSNDRGVLFAKETINSTTSLNSTEHDFSQLPGTLPGFSAALIKEHLDLYARYKAQLKMVQTQDKSLDLAGADKVRSKWRSHVLDLIELQNSVRLHECYFSLLTPKKLSPGLRFSHLVDTYYGSFDQWWIKFRASCMAVRAWGVFGWDLVNKLPVVFGIDLDQQWPIGIAPLLVADMKEHAYCLDYPGDPYAYLDAWRRCINWEKLEEKIKSID